jgi:arylsulfatase A-like enzyme
MQTQPDGGLFLVVCRSQRSSIMSRFVPAGVFVRPAASDSWSLGFKPVIWGLIVFASIVAGLTPAAAEDRRERPNIILAMADDQGWGDVGYYGHPTIKTPVLDEMAREGLRFDRFYAAAPVCSPTRGSVLTGRHPNRFGCFSWGHTLRPQEITIAEAVKQAGYATGHFGKWHLGSCRVESPVSPGNSGFDEWVSAPNFYENDPLLCHNGIVKQYHGESSMVTVEAALEFISQTQDQPFLAVIWFGSPHTPLIASDEILQEYPGLPPQVANYLGEITGIDRAMGRLREELRKRKIADNTLIWYTSDNGPQAAARHPGSAGGLRGRKASLWEGGVRVPTIIEWPAVVNTPRATDVAGNTFDMYPTILDILGITIDRQPPLDGVSLLPLIRGESFERSRPIGFWVHPTRGVPRRSHDLLAEQMEEQQTGREPSVDVTQEGKTLQTYPVDEFPGAAAWMDGEWKLHRIPAREGEFRYELYNLRTDREESRDLADSQPERIESMKQELRRWQAEVVRSLNGEDDPQ